MRTIKFIAALFITVFALASCNNSISETDSLYETSIEKGEVVPPGEKG